LEDRGGASMGIYELWQSVKGTTYPTHGIDPVGGTGGRSDFGAHPSSFDCSGFVAWVYNKASGGAINLPAFTDSLASSPLVHPITAASAVPGDLVLYKFQDAGQPGVAYPHVAIFAGNGTVIQSGGNAHNVNTAPVTELPGATYWHVTGAPAFSGTETPVTIPTGPVDPKIKLVAPPGMTPPVVIGPGGMPIPPRTMLAPPNADGSPTLAHCGPTDFQCMINNSILQWKWNWIHWWDTWTGAHAANLSFIVLGLIVTIIGLGALVQATGIVTV
jgi:NlpC/P60 family